LGLFIWPCKEFPIAERQHWEGLREDLVMVSGEVNAERALEISQTLTVAEGIPPEPNPIGIILKPSRCPGLESPAITFRAIALRRES